MLFAPIGMVLADAEFDSEANHEHIRQRLGAKSIIPARRRGVPNGAIRNQMFRAFPKKPYRQRTKVETIFSAVKRKLSSRAPGRSLATQVRQALLLGLAYNLYRLRHCTTHRGCQQSPTLMSILVGVDSKRFIVKPKSFRCNIYKKHGGRGYLQAKSSFPQFAMLPPVSPLQGTTFGATIPKGTRFLHDLGNNSDPPGV
jgi:hypothetical protein